MPTEVKKAFILTCNVSLEYEKPEEKVIINWKDAEQREKMVEAERKWTDDKVRKVIELKRLVCKDGQGFVVLNQKGIDPMSLDMLSKEGIMALRRVKRRNMERLTLACGDDPVNSVDDLTPSVLGYAEHVYEQQLAEEKFTFVTGVKNPFSCTILFKGPNKHSIVQTQDAVRDGLRAVKNMIEDGAVLPGGGAFELAASAHLLKQLESAKLPSLEMKLGVQAFAKALLIVPKILATNSGFELVPTMLKLEDEHRKGHIVGLDLQTGEPMDPIQEGVFDNVGVKKQILEASTIVASQLLLVDEVLKAGKASQ
jgi:T-complex protein 1 subunit zeta